MWGGTRGVKKTRRGEDEWALQRGMMKEDRKQEEGREGAMESLRDVAMCLLTRLYEFLMAGVTGLEIGTGGCVKERREEMSSAVKGNKHSRQAGGKQEE